MSRRTAEITGKCTGEGLPSSAKAGAVRVKNTPGRTVSRVEEGKCGQRKNGSNANDAAAEREAGAEHVCPCKKSASATESRCTRKREKVLREHADRTAHWLMKLCRWMCEPAGRIRKERRGGKGKGRMRPEPRESKREAESASLRQRPRENQYSSAGPVHRETRKELHVRKRFTGENRARPNLHKKRVETPSAGEELRTSSCIPDSRIPALNRTHRACARGGE